MADARQLSTESMLMQLGALRAKPRADTTSSRIVSSSPNLTSQVRSVLHQQLPTEALKESAGSALRSFGSLTPDGNSLILAQLLKGERAARRDVS